jgi:hypothetical protein
MASPSASEVLSTLRALLERIEHSEVDLYDNTTRDAVKRMLRNRITAIETVLSLASEATNAPQE